MSEFNVGEESKEEEKMYSGGVATIILPIYPGSAIIRLPSSILEATYKFVHNIHVNDDDVIVISAQHQRYTLQQNQ